MKKLILLSLLSFIGMSAWAQLRPDFIMYAGYQTSMQPKLANALMHHGYQIGVGADFRVYQNNLLNLSVRPGVRFSGKGTRIQATLTNTPEAPATTSNTNNTGARTTNLNFVEVPVLVNANFDLADNLKVYANAGPYLGLFVGGNQLTNAPKATSQKIAMSNTNYNKFEAGINIGAGIEFSRVLMGVDTSCNLTNYTKAQQPSQLISFAFNVGYRF